MLRQRIYGGLHCLKAWQVTDWRYGLVKADHYRPIEEQNFKQPLLTIPHVSVSFLSVGGAKLKQNGKFNR